MLTRAESFGRTEAQKDQKDQVLGESAVKAHGDMSSTTTEALSLPNPTPSASVAASPRTMLARSNSLAVPNFSPSVKPRQALSRTTSMPNSPSKPAVVASGLGAESDKTAMPSNVGVPVKRTYGRARGTDLQRVNDPYLSEESHQGGTISPKSPVYAVAEKSHVSPARHPLEQRESYADLVRRLEMDDDETQEWEESAGSTVS